MDESAKELQQREQRAFGKKTDLDALYQEIALNFYPERADFTVTRALGEEFAIDLFDSEPLRCRRDLGNARTSMLRPGGQKWCEIKTQNDRLNERPKVARFLDWLNERFRTKLYHQDSGFVDCEKTADMDVVTFGGAIKTAESEIDRNGKKILLTRAWHPKDIAYFDDITGVRQDVMFRRFKASARHIVKQFKSAAVHDDIKNAAEREPDREFGLCHVMMPADEYEYYKKPSRGRKDPWVSIYYDSDHKALLREQPSKRFRYVVDRWARIPGSQYFYSPAAMTALPDARGIQTMAMVLLESGEQSLAPPMKAVRQAVQGEIDFRASGITWIDGKQYDESTMGPAIEPLMPANKNLAIGIELINRTTLALRDNWFLTKLNLPQSPEKTAYETSILVEEFVRANIPLFEPWEAALSMMLEEIFWVLVEEGEFSQHPSAPLRFPFHGWPEELAAEELIWTFKNPLRNAIELNQVNQFQTALGLAAGVREIAPNAPAGIDWARGLVDSIRGTGAPAEWIRDEEEVAEEQRVAQVEGDIVKALQGAGAAADIANTGLEAAGKLQDINAAQPVDQSLVYGPV